MQKSGLSISLIWKRSVWLFLVFCSLGEAFHSRADNIELGPGQGSVTPAQHIDYLEDPRNHLSIAEVLHQGEGLPWQKLQQDVAGFGFNDSPLWLRIPVHVTPSAGHWLLEIDYPHLDYLDIYFVANGQVIQEHHLGDSQPFNARPAFYRDFLVNFPDDRALSHSDGKLVVFFRVQTQGVLKVPIAFIEQAEFWKKEQLELIVKGGYFGLLFVMSFYHFVIFFVVRLRSYFFYVAYVFFIAMYGFSMEGFGFQYLWPDNVAWQQVSTMIFLIFSAMFRCVFSVGFLELKTRWMPGYNFLMAFVFTALLLLVLSPWLPYSLTVRLATLLVIPSTLSCLLIGIVLFFKGVSSARYFIAGWLMYYAGALAATFTNLGFFPVNVISENLLSVGVIAELILFSVALADRINLERQQKLVAQNQSISNLERYKSLYDNAIEGVFQCTLEGKLKGANPAMSTMLGYSNAEDLMQAFNVKGLDAFFDPLPFNEFNQVLRHNGRVQNYELKGFRRDGQTCWLSVSAQVEPASGQEVSVINGFVFDITQRKRSEEQLLFLSRHDPLTGLVNRREFESRLEQALYEVQHKNEVHTLMLLDLDQFKLVNDSCGHVAGDELLRQITLQLRVLTRGGDVLARLGGDEFGILLSNCTVENARQVADKVRIKIQEMRFTWDSRTFELAGSVGLVGLSEEIASIKDLINKADAACLAAKESGRNRVHVFDPSDSLLVSQQTQMQWAARITEALEQDLFELYVQPIVAIHGEEMGIKNSFEVLLRLRYNNELVFPGSFLPSAERYNLMPKVDRWVVRSLFNWLSRHPAKANTISDIAINLSGLTLGDESFAEFLLQQFDEFKIAPEKICFEITETIAVTNLTASIHFIDRFHAIGCSFSLDDFGSGFSSYGYLKNLPVDYLKIDGSFVRDIEHSEIDRAMVESINRIGHVMGKKTIAEFVENDRILVLLREIGVDYAQGYGISKPFPIDQIRALRSTG